MMYRQLEKAAGGRDSSARHPPEGRARSYTESKENCRLAVTSLIKKRALLQMQPKQAEIQGKKVLATTIVMEHKEEEDVAEEVFPQAFVCFKDRCTKEMVPRVIRVNKVE